MRTSARLDHKTPSCTCRRGVCQLTSDIDLVVLSQDMESRPREVVLRQMASCLRFHSLASDIQVIARAKVPIIKFVCVYGRFNVDISINQANGLQAARFVDHWLVHEPALKPLVRVVKQLLQQRALSEVFTGGLGSYSVTLLVLSFLQLHPKLQRGEIIASNNLGVLLMELLELYGKNFGYDECGICVRGAGSYFSKRSHGFFDPKKPFHLCIEDPHDSANDISRGSFAMIAVRSAIGGAFDILQAALCERANDIQGFRRRQRMLHHGMSQRTHMHFGDDAIDLSSTDNKEPESLLGSVLGVSREMAKRRREIKRLYESGSLLERLERLTGTAPKTDPSASVPETTPQTRDEPAPASHEADPVVVAGSGRETVRPQAQTPEEESRYAPQPRRRRKIDPWTAVPQDDQSDSDASLAASDAPYIGESSGSESPPVINIAGRARAKETATKRARVGERKAKKSRLSKHDRVSFWRSKGVAE